MTCIRIPLSGLMVTEKDKSVMAGKYSISWQTWQQEAMGCILSHKHEADRASQHWVKHFAFKDHLL